MIASKKNNGHFCRKFISADKIIAEGLKYEPLIKKLEILTSVFDLKFM